MQCCNSFFVATERVFPPPSPFTHIDLDSFHWVFVQQQNKKRKKCHIDKLFTQNEQMCNQTALYATPQQITRFVSTKLHLKQCKLTDKKLFFYYYFWRYGLLWQFHCCRCTHLNILAQRHCWNYKDLPKWHIYLGSWPEFENTQKCCHLDLEIMKFAHWSNACIGVQ